MFFYSPEIYFWTTEFYVICLIESKTIFSIISWTLEDIMYIIDNTKFAKIKRRKLSKISDLDTNFDE